MKNRGKLTYLILGMGIGIIVTSTLYSIYPNEKNIELNDAIIIDRAKELGMVSLKESINVDNASKAEEKEESFIEDEEKFVKVEIKKGENLEDIAGNLFNLGLIDEKEEFILLAEDKTLDRNFIYGVYEIKNNTSYSTIIKILTGQ